MYCTNCGTSNDSTAQLCSSCGQALPHFPGSVPNYLVQSILVTICCCVPLGIPAIVYAAQVNSKLVAGDVTGAMESSSKAKMWCWLFAVGPCQGR
jgi:hypothetical protein